MYRYLSWEDAADVEAYRLALAMATDAGDELLLGSEGDPGPAPAIRPGTVSSAIRVEIGAREAGWARRWQEALEKGRRLGQQVVIFGP